MAVYFILEYYPEFYFVSLASFSTFRKQARIYMLFQGARILCTTFDYFMHLYLKSVLIAVSPYKNTIA
jgi:hypothetical protein